MSVKWNRDCPSHPECGPHECLRDEMRCAYCGERIDPYPCHGCGRFLTAAQMHAVDAENENPRCESCP
jgi:DNA-directed RNA polymerase subunit RPC12/RpoP